jgi:hypothetical protein
MTLWLKYSLIILIFGGARPHLVSDAQAEHTRKELMHTISMPISSLRACSVHASVPDAYAQHGMKALLKFGTEAYAQQALQFLMRMLSRCISS